MNLKLTLRAGVVAALMALVFGVAVQAQSSRTFIKGGVTQAGVPARSVFVIVSQKGIEKGRSLTGDDGRYYIGSLDAGVYDVVILNGKTQIFKGQATLPKNNIFDVKL